MRTNWFTLALALVLWCSPVAHGATLYVDGNLAGDCTSNDYSIANRNCTGSDGNAYNTALEGFQNAASLSAGDAVEFRAGSYTVSSVYGNSANSWPLGTSWTNAITYRNRAGETVTLSINGLNLNRNTEGAAISYLIFEGDSRSNFVIQRNSGSDSAFNFANAVDHIRLKKLTVQNFLSNGINGGGTVGACPANIEIIDVLVQNNGDSTSGNAHEHGIYPNCSDSWLIEHSYIKTNFGYGIHFHSSVTNGHLNLTARYNLVEGRRSTATAGSAFGIYVKQGSGHKIYRNVVILKSGSGVRLTGCIQTDAASATEVVFNTCYGDSGAGTGVQVTSTAASGTIIKNNIFDDTSTEIEDSDTDTVKDYNLCPTDGCDASATNTVVTATPGFVTAGSDFSLAAGSAAIDAGTAVTGYSCNGTCDIGAFETLVWPSGSPSTNCTVEDGDASTLRINLTNNVHPPLQVTDTTGWSARAAGSGNTVNSIAITGDNRVDLTLNTPITNGQTVDFTYAQTGDLTDSANIGGSSVQEALAITQQGCTNNVGAAASHTFTQAHYEYHYLRGTEAAPVVLAAGEDATRLEVAAGGSVRIRFSIECATADCPATGFYPRYNLDGGGYNNVIPNSFDADNIQFCGTDSDPDIPGNGTATTEQLTTATGFVAGALVRTSNAIPTVDMDHTTNTKTELEYCVMFDTDATGSYAFRIYEQDGSALDTYTNTPTITLTGVAGGSGF